MATVTVLDSPASVRRKPAWIRVKAPTSEAFHATRKLIHTVFPHPTLSEMMHESVLDAYGRVIHS